MVFRSKYGAQIIITPTYIMPPKPTCKVVKREGQRGARIDPKGCKVRTTKDTQGNNEHVIEVLVPVEVLVQQQIADNSALTSLDGRDHQLAALPSIFQLHQELEGP